MRFCLVPADNDNFSVTINCRDHDAKTMTARASDGRPIDLVTVAGVVMVPED